MRSLLLESVLQVLKKILLIYCDDHIEKWRTEEEKICINQKAFLQAIFHIDKKVRHKLNSTVLGMFSMYLKYILCRLEYISA